jgi:hypothetical protein
MVGYPPSPAKLPRQEMSAPGMEKVAIGSPKMDSQIDSPMENLEKSMENHGTSAKMMILGMILGMILEKYYCEHDDSLIFFSAGVLPN